MADVAAVTLDGHSTVVKMCWRMLKLLRLLAALAENLNLVTSTHMGQLTTVTPVLEDLMNSSGFCEYQVCIWYTYTCSGS